MIQKIYLDTSVIGGCFDTEFMEWSNKLIDEILAGERLSVLSDITIDEIQDGPEHVRKKMDIK